MVVVQYYLLLYHFTKLLGRVWLWRHHCKPFPPTYSCEYGHLAQQCSLSHGLGKCPTSPWGAGFSSFPVSGNFQTNQSRSFVETKNLSTLLILQGLPPMVPACSLFLSTAPVRLCGTLCPPLECKRVINELISLSSAQG